VSSSSLATRARPLGDLRIDSEVGVFQLDAASKENVADVRRFIELWVERGHLAPYLTASALDTETFIESMVEKSEGNFMYLRYVLPELAHGAYRDAGIDAIPAGLRNYYEDHWRRMRGQDEDAWFAYKLPVVMALAVAERPVSAELVAELAGVKQLPRVRSVLRDWEQFLRVERSLNGPERRYAIYHSSFQDFISDKEEVADERVSRRGAHERAAESFSDLFE
jgi:hypothetical protein